MSSLNQNIRLVGTIVKAVLVGVLAIAYLAALATAEEIRCPVTRDTRFSGYPGEENLAYGGAGTLKFKSTQEMSLVDFDPTPLQGRQILACKLHLKSTSADFLRRVTVSTFASEWHEGDENGETPKGGSSTFNRKRHPDEFWAGPGSDLTAVMLGMGGTRWRMAEATAPDKDGWQQVAVDPQVVRDRVNGKSFGFLVFDDTGSEWTREGEKFTYKLFPNRLAASRNGPKANAPYFTVTLGEKLPIKEAKPATVDPPAPKPIAVAPMAIPPSTFKPFTEVAPLPKIGNSKIGTAEIAIIDGLDKVQPITGKLIPPQSADYWSANHLWSAKQNTLRLIGARKELVGFQIVVRGKVTGLRARIELESGADPKLAASLQVEWFTARHVPTDFGPLPDPLIPCVGVISVPSTDETIAGQTCGTLYGELILPDVEKLRGKLILEIGDKPAEGQRLEIALLLQTFNFTMSNELGFLPEMNCYGLPENERDYYRLAQRNRTVIARVPYSQRGEVAAGCGPQIDGKSGKLNWHAWDEKFGPLLDGSAFADLPRGKVPLEVLYLPMNENWPEKIDQHYSGGYWADESLTPAYRQKFVEMTEKFVLHAGEKKWNHTVFQGFLNNKVDFKKNGWSRGSSPWLLDEPNNFQDFWALRYFGEAFHDGVRQAEKNLPNHKIKPSDATLADHFLFRADISRPQWQRDSLDHVLDYNVLAGGVWLKYATMIQERAERVPQHLLMYGEANSPTASNVHAAAWCWDAATTGAMGIVPWQTIGNDESWQKADPTALIYPGNKSNPAGPFPSLRLKAFLRGQQDAELVRAAPAAWPGLRTSLGLATGLTTSKTHSEDAATLSYGSLLPQDLWHQRLALLTYLDSHHLPARPWLSTLSPCASRQQKPQGGKVE